MTEELLTMTVSELNQNMKLLIDSRSGLRNIWIKGEISNYKMNSPTGHMYLTLKDEKSVLKACMFRGANSSLRFAPENGMKVIARGRISVYEAGGVYQLYIEEMIPDGIGDLHVAFEQLKEKLRQEGLFDSERKLPLPKYPKRIGVVTSDTGAAVRDVINVLGRRFKYATVILYPAKVQGEGAAQKIAEAIRYFNKTMSADVLIVGRGGGSIEDLWAFNEEVTARAVAGSQIPVISAVGHETDFTICDFAASLRAPTPSAAAEIAVPNQTELLDKLAKNDDRLKYLLENLVTQRRQQLERYKNAAVMTRFVQRIEDARIALDDELNYIAKETNILLNKKQERLVRAIEKLDAISPLKVLKRGYSITTKDDGKTVKSIEELAVGQSVNVKIIDGSIKCVIKDVVV